MSFALPSTPVLDLFQHNPISILGDNLYALWHDNEGKSIVEQRIKEVIVLTTDIALTILGTRILCHSSAPLYDSILVSLGISLISLPAAAQTATLISGLYGLSFLVHSFFIKSVPYLITGLVFTSFAAQVAKQAFTLKAANSYKNDLITHFAERMAKPIANRVVA